MSKSMTYKQIDAYGRATAKLAMGTMVLICLGMLIAFAGAPSFGKPIVLIGILGFALAILSFRYLLSAQDKKVDKFVRDFRNGDRLMGLA
jgi:hypothetical protein